MSNPDLGSLSAAQLQTLSNMEVYEGGINRPHAVLEPVKGLSCHRNAYQSQLLTTDEAIEGVKLEAALLGADAVINLACQRNSGTDWVNNCWASFVCVGTAVKYQN